MTSDRATRALSRALNDLRHAKAMAALAFSEPARKRHERRAAVAASRVKDAQRWIASGSRLLEA